MRKTPLNQLLNALLGLLLLAGCAADPAGPRSDPIAPELAWITPGKPIPLSTPVTVHLSGSGGLEDRTWGYMIQREAYGEQRLTPRERTGTGAADEAGIDPSDEYFTSFPFQLKGTSTALWDGASLTFSFGFAQRVNCVPPPTTSTRVPFQVVMILSRCASAIDASGWNLRANTKRTISVPGQAVVSIPQTLQRLGGPSNWNVQLADASVSGVLPGTCIAASILTLHEAQYVKDGIVTVWEDDQSADPEDGCVPIGPDPCDGGGNDELRSASEAAPKTVERKRVGMISGAPDANLGDGEVVYPGPNCGTGGSPSPSGDWHCYTVITYWVETGIILAIDRWCEFVASASLSGGGVAAANGASLLRESRSSAPAAILDGGSLAVRLIIKADLADSSAQAVFYGGTGQPDELVLGGALADPLRVSRALAAWRGLAMGKQTRDIPMGAATRVPLRPNVPDDRRALPLIAMVRDALSAAVGSPEALNRRYGPSRSIVLSLPAP